MLLLVLVLTGVAVYLTDKDKCEAAPSSHALLPDEAEIGKLPPDGGPKYNRLIFSHSPYLLQHAANPVDWYEWGSAAFEKAAKEDKPIFLSIGYSTCHWCHVMARESFESEEIAALLNEHFVSIKVDREERPDVDNVYMTVCQALTQSGGWPLTIIMTPKGKPFFAGTYFPPETRMGRTGLNEILTYFAENWQTERESWVADAEKITHMLESSGSAQRAGAMPGLDVLKSASIELLSTYDREHGGFGNAPKFPIPHHYTFLLRWWLRTGDKEALDAVTAGLKAMRSGGLFDQVGFGFHRYATDAEFLVPHFEKMLYDQALLVMAYAETYQATGDPFYAQVASEVLTYVQESMTAPEGGFYSAEDADSEGEEGKYYVWTTREVHNALGLEDGKLWCAVFEIKEDGNYHEPHAKKTHANIPHLRRPIEAWAAEYDMDASAFRKKIESLRQKLLNGRRTRIAPSKDDKIITAWNGLMIAALAHASRALDQPEYAAAARRAADFVLTQMRQEGRLLRRFRSNKAALLAYADDYAFLVWGLIELYEATFDVKYLKEALALNNAMLALFWDDEKGGLFFTGRDAEKLITRPKEVYDGALPSANSVAALNLLRLAKLVGREDLTQKAGAILNAFSSQVSRNPAAYTQFLNAVDFALGPNREVVVAFSSNSHDTSAHRMLQEINRRFLPRTVVHFRQTDGNVQALISIAPYVEPLRPVVGGSGDNEMATAYVCENFACKAPIIDIKKLITALDTVPGAGSL